MTNSNTTPTGTALTLTTDQVRAEIQAVIKSGGAVSKELAKLAPKGFISKCRADRKNELMANSGRIMGELSQRGFLVAKMGEVKLNGRTGDEKMVVEFVKPSAKAAVSLDEVKATLGNLSPEALAQFLSSFASKMAKAA